MKQECHVIHSPDGGWITKSSQNGTGRRYGSKQDAVTAARDTLRNSGGGEIIIHGRDGRVRDRDTVFSKR